MIGGDTVILSLDNQAQPIYTLVDPSSTIIILVTIIKYVLLYCTWPTLFVLPLIILIAWVPRSYLPLDSFNV